jgi:GTP-binding protein Era
MFRSGYVAVVGLPNVGKSTLVNKLLGEKLSIVTDKPQTTRHRIRGILSRPAAQIILLDTPGFHHSAKPLNERIVEAALHSLADADLVLHMIFPRQNLSPEDREIAERIKAAHKTYFVLINRVDEVSKESLLPLIEQVQKNWSPDEIIPIAALDGSGLEKLLPLIEAALPEGPAFYPSDLYTDHDVRFLCAELIREKAMELLHQEIPYSLVTQIESFKEEDELIRIHAAIVIEKDSQKGIIIGAGGKMIKKIGSLARQDMEKMLGKKVYLELFVKVVEGWTKDLKRLKEFGIE